MAKKPQKNQKPPKELSNVVLVEASIPEIANKMVQSGKKHHSVLWGSFVFIFGILFISIIGLAFNIYRQRPISRIRDTSPAVVKTSLQRELVAVSGQIKELEDTQTSYNIRVVDGSKIQQQIVDIQLEIRGNDYRSARHGLALLSEQVNGYKLQLAKQAKESLAKHQILIPIGKSLTVPILIYHYTPNDFENQLLALIQKGYTTIDLDTLVAALGSDQIRLPAKPVIITFDDGFANQEQAFTLLEKYHMKATFYIITGGEASGYCIGANRKYDQPKACGDAYLNWDQIIEMDKSGLITIAAHTVDHLSLPGQSVEVQKFQLLASKNELESRLGHPVLHFAYPYGSYSAVTEQLVRQAGFISAVSTLPGTIHTESTLFSLHRVRDAYKLP